MRSCNTSLSLPNRKRANKLHDWLLRSILINILLLTTLTGLFSCRRRSKEPDSVSPTDTAAVAKESNKPDLSAYYLPADSIFFRTRSGNSFDLGKNDFNKIIDDHPELVEDYMHDPDLLYYSKGMEGRFNSEQGQDLYYMVYAYLLKNKNGELKHAARRKKLLTLYSDINSLFGHFEYGGTYFGHQEARIMGYAEYSVYLFTINQSFSKTYDIQKQKKLYIQSLRQLVNDENSIDFNTQGKEKTERHKALHKIVDDIEKEITDNYYLRRTQEFHYGHYEYY